MEWDSLGNESLSGKRGSHARLVRLIVLGLTGETTIAKDLDFHRSRSRWEVYIAVQDRGLGHDYVRSTT
jgi:hypothetical protein